jgi:hypothetical protein
VAKSGSVRICYLKPYFRKHRLNIKVLHLKSPDSDTGEDLAEEVRKCHIPDFSNWKNHDDFEAAFVRLEKDLCANIGRLREILCVAPASGGFNSASRRIGLAGRRQEWVIPEKTNFFHQWFRARRPKRPARRGRYLIFSVF